MHGHFHFFFSGVVLILFFGMISMSFLFVCSGKSCQERTYSSKFTLEGNRCHKYRRRWRMGSRKNRKVKTKDGNRESELCVFSIGVLGQCGSRSCFSDLDLFPNALCVHSSSCMDVTYKALDEIRIRINIIVYTLSSSYRVCCDEERGVDCVTVRCCREKCEIWCMLNLD